MKMYYQDKITSLKQVFGAQSVTLDAESITVDGKKYPVIDDVIIISPPEKQTASVKQTLNASGAPRAAGDFARDIQSTFGQEWTKYPAILEEHKKEFGQYFDLVDTGSLKDKRVSDLGCGNGRWSYFLKDKCRELVLIDFSDAVFVARNNLRDANNCIFFMCDIKSLPFKENFCDLIFTLGVLHHLPTDCLNETRALKKYAPQLLVFLYYALDNRPVYFRVMLKAVTVLRLLLSRIQSEILREVVSVAGTLLIYKPMIGLGRILELFGAGKYVPLFEFYRDKSFTRIEQDVYDRFFTRIEQRVTRREISRLTDTFFEVKISENLPYWHFLCSSARQS